MKHLKKFNTHLQTFNLQVVSKGVRRNNVSFTGKEVLAYAISHETSYGEAASYEIELKRLFDLAVLDLVPLDQQQLRVILEQLNVVKKRFESFWDNFHNYIFDHGPHFPSGFLSQILLPQLFIVRNLQPDFPEIIIDEIFVDDLTASISLRETYLADLIKQAERLLSPEEEQTQPPAQPMTGKSVKGVPSFTDGMAEKFAEVLKVYFSQDDQERLLPLFLHKQAPTSPLLFHGNGKQLADAFKQLYEANLIVGCLKGELEAWIADRFAYVYRGHQKALPRNYLSTIISSNTKPCQSPILDVRKQGDGTFTIVSVLRTQKNYSSC